MIMGGFEGRKEEGRVMTQGTMCGSQNGATVLISSSACLRFLATLAALHITTVA